VAEIDTLETVREMLRFYGARG